MFAGWDSRSAVRRKVSRTRGAPGWAWWAENNRSFRPEEISKLVREFHWSLDQAQMGGSARCLTISA
jgi:hypothetical protein